MNHIVDVVIPSYKPGEKLRRCLTMLSKQTLPPEYIFIINTEKNILILPSLRISPMSPSRTSKSRILTTERLGILASGNHRRNLYF